MSFILSSRCLSAQLIESVGDRLLSLPTDSPELNCIEMDRIEKVRASFSYNSHTTKLYF